MKNSQKLLLIFSLFCMINSYSQNIGIMPISTHYYDPYIVTVNGAGTLYYTTDGTDPNLASNSAINTFNINITNNTTLKVFLIDNNGNTSTTITKKYYVGALPQAKIFFKPPPSWNSSCVRVEMVNPNAIDGMVIDTFNNGYQLINANCDGWLKKTDNIFYENANLWFNNCPLFPNDPTSIFTNLIPTNSVMVYDFANGEITNPPSCLNLSTDEVNNSTIVKIYPNPVQDFIHINTSLDFVNFKILNAEGRRILEGRINKEKIDISQLEIGKYYLQLSSNTNKKAIIAFIKK